MGMPVPSRRVKLPEVDKDKIERFNKKTNKIMKNKELDPKTEKKVEAISQTIVLVGALIGLYYIAVFAEWIEPLF